MASEYGGRLGWEGMGAACGGGDPVERLRRRVRWTIVMGGDGSRLWRGDRLNDYGDPSALCELRRGKRVRWTIGMGWEGNGLRVGGFAVGLNRFVPRGLAMERVRLRLAKGATTHVVRLSERACIHETPSRPREHVWRFGLGNPSHCAYRQESTKRLCLHAAGSVTCFMLGR